MNRLYLLLKEHSVRYPRMMPTDAVKLIYQNVFGGGHMIPDENTALLRLNAELDGLGISASAYAAMPETTSSDTASVCAAMPETTSSDTASVCAAMPETTSSDTASVCVAMPETTSSDTASAYAAMPETTSSDTASAYAAMPETTSSDTASVCAAVPDSTAADSMTAHTAAPDTAVSDVKSADTQASYQACEDIGGGLVRLHLKSLPALGITPRQLCRMFVYTANTHTGSVGGFEASAGDIETSAGGFEAGLDVLRKAVNDGMFAFGSAELENYLASYKSNEGKWPPVSHSEEYRAEYSPAYRVIDAYYVRLIPVIARLNRMLCTKSHVTAAIEGRCASGKTTAAELLSFVFDNSPIIHMDDFFLPPELRTPDRYSEPGGNVHYERFAKEVLLYLGKKDFSYRAFDCSKGTYGENVGIPLSPLTIVEGSYCLHPSLGDYAGLNIFCDVESNEQMRRIRERNGSYAEVFRTRWIPLEERYFEACRPDKRCHAVLN